MRWCLHLPDCLDKIDPNRMPEMNSRFCKPFRGSWAIEPRGHVCRALETYQAFNDSAGKPETRVRGTRRVRELRKWKSVDCGALSTHLLSEFSLGKRKEELLNRKFAELAARVMGWLKGKQSYALCANSTPVRKLAHVRTRTTCGNKNDRALVFRAYPQFTSSASKFRRRKTRESARRGVKSDEGSNLRLGHAWPAPLVNTRVQKVRNLQRMGRPR